MLAWIEKEKNMCVTYSPRNCDNLSCGGRCSDIHGLD